MFEDFEKSDASKEGRGRMGVSLVISGVIFLSIGAALAAAIATARVVVRRAKSDVDVSFAALPRPQAPKPKPTVTKARASKDVRPVTRPSTPPKEIPDEKPEEAEGDLAEAGKLGPVEGMAGGGNTGPAPAPAPAPPPPPVVKATPQAPPPEQQAETIALPRFVSGCRAPEIPEKLLSLAATIAIDVRMLIGADGKVLSATILKAHPLVPDDLILRCAREQVFEPAHLPDGTAVAYPFRRRFVFRPASA
jgi:periplasmic protein TonB